MKTRSSPEKKPDISVEESDKEADDESVEDNGTNDAEPSDTTKGGTWRHRRPLSQWLEAMKAYVEEHGNVTVPHGYKQEYKGETINLGFWLSDQKQKKRKGKLKQEIEEGLRALGLDFDEAPKKKRRSSGVPVEEKERKRKRGKEPSISDDQMVAYLRAYKDQFGHVDLSTSYEEEHNGETVKLGIWISKMRESKKKGLLDDALREELDSLGLIWQKRKGGGHGRRAAHPSSVLLELLKQYEEEFGDFNVPHVYERDHEGTPIKLGHYVQQMRQKHKKGVLDETLKDALNAIGFPWFIGRHGEGARNNESTASYSSTTDMVDHLKAYQSEFGRLTVPLYYQKYINGKKVKLGFWVAHVRRKFKEGKLEAGLQEALNAMGFDFQPRRGGGKRGAKSCSFDETAMKMVGHLRQYQEEFGKLTVPLYYKKDFDGDAVKLGFWVATVRRKFKEGKLDSSIQEALDSMGFDFQPSSARRGKSGPSRKTDMMPHIIQFYEQFGHTKVPHGYKVRLDGGQINLGWWVSSMRQKHRRGSVDPELRRKLDDMGFVWNPSGAPVEGKDHENNDSSCLDEDELCSSAADSETPRWKPISSEEDSDMIYCLWDYNYENGHMNVPPNFRLDSGGRTHELGAWVEKIRRRHKNGTVVGELFDKLNNMGFNWNDSGCEINASNHSAIDEASADGGVGL